MDAVVGFMTTPWAQFVLTLVGGGLLKAWPRFFNKAIPAATLLFNAILTMLGTMFGPADAHAGIPGGTGHLFGNVFAQAVVPWLMATGAHGVFKNGVIQWSKAGWKVTVSPQG